MASLRPGRADFSKTESIIRHGQRAGSAAAIRVAGALDVREGSDKNLHGSLLTLTNPSQCCDGIVMPMW
ncbi:hypothetical protein [Micromonospora sp. NBRC 107095]|uniref:hypothetical protein n=1 Tax=Micromonospora sp. NBRC 107095 TaxID=3032209 RepID=UPI0024A1C969|nr:hypothetical protein [Micromonospora sp. NBRC 107095]GLZ62926.1 hypothetical protein Misp05_65020 [Micromonospora sp. NBRC 107095]